MAEQPRSAAVDIVLPTYNGMPFVEQQLDSILGQTHEDWRLFIRDDGSSDATPNILRQYAGRHPDRISLIEDGDGNLGCNDNFGRLLAASDADHVALCDQDDIWLPEKLALTLAEMRRLESRHGVDAPLLVHTDLEVVDRTGDPIAPSFWRYHDLTPETGSALGRLLVRNVVTGCTAMLNSPLKRVCLPIPSEARNHDWWIALAAAAFGHIGHISQPTVRYRNHDHNANGARRKLSPLALHLAADLFLALPDHRRRFGRSLRQARAFRDQFSGTLTAEQRRIVEGLIELPDRSALGAMRDARRWQYTPPGLPYRLGLVLVASGLDTGDVPNAGR